MRAWMALAVLLLATPVHAQSSGSTSGAMSVINSSDPSSTTTRLITTPTVVAPGLAAAGVETCLGSASGGLSAIGGGFTFGTTTVDEGCTIRLLARQLYAFGFQRAALALMCEDQHVVVAMYAAGSPCPRSFVATTMEPKRHTFFGADSEPVQRSSFAAATESTASVFAADSETTQRSSFAVAAELTPNAGFAADSAPSLRSFFEAIFQPSQDSSVPERRARENGIN
jgi:hypothetical protein